MCKSPVAPSHGSLWQSAREMVPECLSPGIRSLCDPPPLEMGAALVDWILTNKAWQKRCYVTSKRLSYRNTRISILGGLALSGWMDLICMSSTCQTQVSLLQSQPVCSLWYHRTGGLAFTSREAAGQWPPSVSLRPHSLRGPGLHMA